MRAFPKQLLQEALSEDVKDTYNMVSVDGDTSTNDTVLLLANGMAENPEINEKGEDYQKLQGFELYQYYTWQRKLPVTERVQLHCLRSGSLVQRVRNRQ